MTAFGRNIHFLAIIWMHRSHLFHAVALSGKTYCAFKSLPLYFFQCWNLLVTAQISEQSLIFSLINHIQQSCSTACKAFCFVSTEQRQYYNNKTHSHDKLGTVCGEFNHSISEIIFVQVNSWVFWWIVWYKLWNRKYLPLIYCLKLDFTQLCFGLVSFSVQKYFGQHLL